jgi:hypothetical protein
MSRITIHLKRAGHQLRDNNNTTLSSPKTIFFNRHQRHSSTQFWDHPYPFDTTIKPGEEEDPEIRLSADQTPLPPSPSLSPSIINDDVVEERLSTAGSNRHHHNNHDLIHKPPPLVIARPKIHDIQIV